MKTFHPKVEIRLIKTDRRSEVAPGTATAKRYSALQSLDITPYLFDGGVVQIQKSVHEPAGAWSFSLVDRMVPEINETLYALLEPQDLIEIRMAREPHDPAYKSKLPIVMRGFVSHVTRRRSMSDGHPMRVIQITGHDTGKLLQILRIFYLNNSAVGDNILAALRFFAKYAGPGEAKIMSGKDFVQLVLDKVVNPYVGLLTVNANGEKVGTDVVRSITADVSIDGAVSPHAVNNFEGGSVHQFLCQNLDIGVWNEMLLEDCENGIHLVIRPNPFLGVDGKRVHNGPPVDVVEIDADHVEEITESRSDEDVGNYFWVTNTGWQLFDNGTQKQLADATPTGDYVLFEYQNSHAGRYGIRKMECESRMGPITLQNSDATPASEKQTEADKRLAWISERRRVLAAQNKDNVVFESGSMVLCGNEKIKRGSYLRVNYGRFSALYYVVAVAHQFVPFNSFKTTVTFERGTGFIERAQRDVAPYLAEMNLKGAA